MKIPTMERERTVKREGRGRKRPQNLRRGNEENHEKNSGQPAPSAENRIHDLLLWHIIIRHNYRNTIHEASQQKQISQSVNQSINQSINQSVARIIVYTVP